MADGRIALVTGAGSGIGSASSLALLKSGWSVVLAGRRREALEEVAAAAESGRALVVPTDVTRPDDIEALFAATGKAYGRLDLLFNNAGVLTPNMPLEDLPLALWREAVDTNLTGAFLCTQAAFRIMKEQSPRGGRIINNGSISAHVPRPLAIAYTATKHAMTGMTKQTSLDGRTYDIACGQLDIGNVDTAMVGRMKKGVPQADGSVKVEPTFDLQAVADAVLYMASLPLDANVPFMTILATKMPYVGRG